MNAINPCYNDNEIRYSSTDKSFQAAVYLRHCKIGCTAEVSILDHGDKLENDIGNIYSGDVQRYCTSSEKDQSINSAMPKVVWSNNFELTIQGGEAIDSAIYKEHSWGWPWSKVYISYKK